MVQGQVTGLIDVTILCLGPIMTPMVKKAMQDFMSKKETIKLPGMLLPERCAEMMCVAIANKFNTVWICANPVLVFFYWNQYMPGIFQRYIVSRIPWNKVDSQKKKK